MNSYSDTFNDDFCRVCHSKATKTKPLFHPCICTGSIKFIHEACLFKWLKYSKRRTCELCNHRFKFSPIYAPNTPQFLPFNVLLYGLFNNFRKIILNWLHVFFVLNVWLVIVPLAVCRIYRCLFTGSFSSLLTLPLDILSTNYIIQDCIQGFLIVVLTLVAFLGYIALHDQLARMGEPDWLIRDTHNNRNIGPDTDANIGVNAGRLLPDIFNIFEADVANEEDVNNTTERASFARSSNNIPESSQYNVEPQGSINALSLVDEGQYSDEESVDQSIPESEDGENLDDQNEDHNNWEHLLGLDGSLVFLEHVLWLIAFSTLFIVIFAFCPNHLGQFALIGLKLEHFVLKTRMEGIITTLFGYVISALLLLILYTSFKFLNMYRACYWTGLAYVYLRIGLITLLEMGIFPVFCGFWIDICTLSLFNVTINQRIGIFHYAPFTFTFLHWVVGMLYVFYMTSFLLIFQNVLRPGLLRFYHFNDPDFKLIQDMINQPLSSYAERLVGTYSVWGILIVAIFWVPSEIVRHVLPQFLPLRIVFAHDSPLDYIVELFLLQFVLPFLVDAQAQMKFSQLLRWWTIGVSSILNLRSYLLGDVEFEAGDYIINESGDEVPFEATTTPFTEPTTSHSQVFTNDLSTSTTTCGSNGNGEAGDGANLHEENEEDNRPNYLPYKKPSLFPLRLVGLLLLIIPSLVCCSLFLLIVPIGLGRFIISIMSKHSHSKHDIIAIIIGLTLIGLMLRIAWSVPFVIINTWNLILIFARQTCHLVCWSRSLYLPTRFSTTCGISLLRPFPRAQISVIRNQLSSISMQSRLVCCPRIRNLVNTVQLLCVATILAGLIPFVVGLLINLTFIIPLRVPPTKTLIIGFWEHWIFGIIHIKLITLFTVFGPHGWLLNRLESIKDEINQHGWQSRSSFILSLFSPILFGLLLSLAMPYLFAYYMSPILNLDLEYVLRNIYLCIAILLLTSLFIVTKVDDLRRLYKHIKDENYLIGRELVNFRSEESSLSPIPIQTQ